MSNTHKQSDAKASRADRQFRARADEVAAFHTAHGRFPSGRSSDPAERLIGRWLSSVRTARRGKIGRGPTVTDARIALMSEIAPGWDAAVPGNVANDGLFSARLATVAAFMAEHERTPRVGTDEADGLGAWLGRLRAAANGTGNMAWNDDRARLVEEALPGWLNGTPK